MNKIAFFVLLLTTPFYHAKSQNTSAFKENNYKKTIKQSRATQKPILLYFAIEDNAVCQRFEQEILNASEIQKVLSKEFICQKITNDESDGERLASSFGINAYPCLVFTNAKQELIHKIIAPIKIETATKTLNSVLQGSNTLSYFDLKFQQLDEDEISDKRWLLDYAYTLLNAGEGYNEVIELYFKNLDERAMQLPNNVEAIIQFCNNIYSKEVTFFIKNYQNLKTLNYPSSAKLLKVESVISNHLLDAMQANPALELRDTLDKIIGYFAIADVEMIQLRVYMDYYRDKADENNSYVKYAQQYLHTHVDYLNSNQISQHINELVKTTDDRQILEELMNLVTMSMDKDHQLASYITRLQILKKMKREAEAKDFKQEILDRFSKTIRPEEKAEIEQIRLEK